MKDLVPKGTGNSRLLRSSIPADITFAEMVTMLRDGTFPVDFAGLNSAGVAVVGSAYNKANVLPDDVCASLGIATTAEPKDAFLGILQIISNTESDILSRFVTGTYTGNSPQGYGTFQGINLGFRPKAVFVIRSGNGIIKIQSSSTLILFAFATNVKNAEGLEIVDTGFYVGDISGLNSTIELNTSGNTYTYFAIR